MSYGVYYCDDKKDDLSSANFKSMVLGFDDRQPLYGIAKGYATLNPKRVWVIIDDQFTEAIFIHIPCED